MEKKKYKMPEEEQTTNKVYESAISALAYSKAIDQEVDWENRIPIFPNATLEELMADIEQSEREFKERKGVSWNTAKEMIENRIKNYAR